MADEKKTPRKNVDDSNKDSDKAAQQRLDDAEARNAEVREALKSSNDEPRTPAQLKGGSKSDDK